MPEPTKEELEYRLNDIEQRLALSTKACGRQACDVNIVAASKKQSPQLMSALQQCLLARGKAVIFGESYLQDFTKKQNELRPPFQLHMIGPLQSNKVKDVVGAFDMIESVHSEKIALAINQAAAAIAKTQEILVQVNVSHDSAKSGVLPELLRNFLTECLGKCSHLSYRGLMTITRHYEERELVRSDFHLMRQLLAETADCEVSKRASEHKALELSMGMSDDYDIAVEEGATLVRIGTALFGAR